MRKRGENTIMTFTPALKNRKTGKKEGMDKNPPLLPYDKKGTKNNVIISHEQDGKEVRNNFVDCSRK